MSTLKVENFQLFLKGDFLMYERYCKLRDSKGLNDSQVAAQCGFNKSTFSDWKKGKSDPKLPKIQKITEILNCSIDYLVTGKEYNATLPEQAELFVEIRHDVDLLNALEKYMKLSDEKKKHVIDTINMLSEV